jgi:hypothetical protein
MGLLAVSGAPGRSELPNRRGSPVRRHFLWARRIPYTDIAGVDLEDVPVRYRSDTVIRHSPAVIIVTHRGEEIELRGFSAGLFDSLSAAWEQSKAAG